MLKEKIKGLKERLKTWNRDQYGDTLKKYKKIEVELNQLEVSTIDRQLSPQDRGANKKTAPRKFVGSCTISSRSRC